MARNGSKIHVCLGTEGQNAPIPIGSKLRLWNVNVIIGGDHAPTEFEGLGTCFKDVSF